MKYRFFDTNRDSHYTILATIFGIAFGLLTNYLYIAAFTDTRIPVQVNATWFVEKTASPGDVVNLMVTRHKFRDCPMVRHTFWINIDGTIFPDGTKSGGSVGISDGPVSLPPISIKIPSDIPVGEWGFDPILYYNCPDRVWRIKQPIAWIQIVDKKEN